MRVSPWRGAAVGLGAAATATTWVLQHRAVSRAQSEAAAALAAAAADAADAADGVEAAGSGPPPEGRGPRDAVPTLPRDAGHHYLEMDDGATIHVVERGHGPAVVLLHGFMLQAVSWGHQVHDLSQDHRVLAVDLRGHGGSSAGPGFSAPPGARSASAEGPPGTSRAVGESAHGIRRLAAEGPPGTSRPADEGAPGIRRLAVEGPPGTSRPADEGAPGIRRLAADVGSVLGALGVERAVVAGHSLGGMVALQLACDLEREELDRRVAGLALVSTMAGPYSSLPGWGRFVRLVAPVPVGGMHLAERVGARELPLRDLRWWSSRLAFGTHATPAQVRFVQELISEAPLATVAGLLVSLGLFDLSDRLGEIDLPCLVVAGTHDRLTPPRHARHAAQALPHAELVELAGCGHMSIIERRAEVSELLGKFGDRVSGTAGHIGHRAGGRGR